MSSSSNKHAMSGSAPAANEGKEEQYLFRCESEELAKRIRTILRNTTKARKEDSDMDLRWGMCHPPAAAPSQPWTGEPLRSGILLRLNAFAVSDREGVFTLGGSEYPCQLMDLPGIVESYKTYNDVHLVKSTDVGQVNCTSCSPSPLPFLSYALSSQRPHGFLSCGL